ncbi:MAG: class I SAM-dependent methyltransferase [Chloroflexota bacterium]|nr:class I SAM-dependent methyltransferase [Chloroflexota bacterium]
MYTRSADLYDAIYAFKDYAAEARRLRELIEPVRRGDGATLLDVACGTGGHIPFLRDHYAVEGLDFSPRMLDVARRRNPGLVFHQADMASFELDRRFNAVVCLFSAIGYVGTLPNLHQAIATFARHLNPGGVVAVEPWKTPDTWIDGHISTLTVDQPELKIARMCVSERQGTRSIMNMHHLVATPAGVDYFTERHEMGLFTHDEYLAAFATAGLATSFDQEGLMGRGLYIGVRP